MDERPSIQKKLGKIFGTGPAGAVISLLLLAIFVEADSGVGPAITGIYADFLKGLGMALMACGLGLHAWSFYTLRHWWVENQLCTRGPFRFFRHPMYTAWITFLCPGLALYLNSWFYVLWVVVLHLLWHQLVKPEEAAMGRVFGETYTNYAKQTGRFFPKVLRRESV